MTENICSLIPEENYLFYPDSSSVDSSTMGLHYIIKNEPNAINFNHTIYDEPECLPISTEASDSTMSLFSEISSRTKEYEINPFEACFKSKVVKGSEPNPFEESFKSLIKLPRRISYNNKRNESITSQSSVTLLTGEMTSSYESQHELLKARNRKSAAKCRQKKKEWLLMREEEVKKIENENHILSDKISELKNEILNIKMILASHVDCKLNE